MTGRIVRTALLAVGVCVIGDATAADASTACKPILSVQAVTQLRASPMPVQPWTWRATIVADSGFCATGAGNFEIDFIRIKENSKDLQFTERFRWQKGQFEVAVEFAPDEAVLAYRIGFVAPCVCSELPPPSGHAR
jgi:hypothetical protein